MSDIIATLNTPRMLASAMTPAHFQDLRQLLTDPLVMKTLASAGKPLADEEIRMLVQQQVEHWRRHGFGFWVFHRCDDGQFIGRGGLKVYEIEGQEVIGLAYAVVSEHWNQGYAAEIARASLDVGFKHLGLPEVCSWTLPINRASQRVMEKLGFRYERDFEFAGLGHRFYRLARDEWKAYDGGEQRRGAT
jgi:RimJ/RimL family protein N-acetyltransferase